MIRPMMIKDSVHVQHIVRETWSETYKDSIPEEIQNNFINRSFSNEMLLMRMEKSNVLIAESDGIPIGFANFTHTDEDGDVELTEMYILSSHQKCGYGKKLLQAILTLLIEAQQLFVYVDNRNKGGKDFYEKQGFSLLSIFDEQFEGHAVQTAQYVYTIHNHVLV